MKPNERQRLLDSILEAFACFDPTPEEAEHVMNDATDEWDEIHANLNEPGWAERQKFSRSLSKALCNLRDERAEAYWTERNEYDGALGRKCDAAAAVEAARALK